MPNPQIQSVADTAPTRIGKYQVTDLLGQGAMGVVYRALDPLLNRYVAIKVMSKGIAADQELRDRFMREARAAGSLQHPNIITIYDFGESDGLLYIAMEYIEGSDLSEIMSRHDPLPLPAKIGIVVDALHALDYAHGRGVVHRDVKPANIRVSVDGRAKLMDFGIARLEKSNLTRSGVMIGTPDYMAPEQVTGGEITAATDVFAMGVVLYEFLANRRTFEGETLHAVLYKVVSEQPPPLRDVAHEVPVSLQPIVDKALAKNPAHRYPTAGLMARDLESVRTALSGGATIRVEARSTPLRTARLRRLPQRRSKRRAVWIGALVAVVVAGVAAAVLVLHPFARRGAADGPERLAEAPGAPAGAQPAAPSQPRESLAAAESIAPPESAVAESEPHVVERGDEGAAPLRGARREPVRAAQPGGDVAERSPARPRGEAAAPAHAAPRRAAPPADTVSAPPIMAPERTPVMAPQPAAPQPAPAETARKAAPAPAPVAPAPPPDPRPLIEALVTSYGHAIETRNVNEIRHLYPGLTDQQQRAWEQLFSNVKDLAVRLSITTLYAHGATADLVVSGTYTFDYQGRSQQQQIGFHATAAQSSATAPWLFTTIR
jgi:predicted Ser/Thr protein kinase